MRTSIGIDIGGTKILIGIVTESGEILRAKRYPMQRQTQQEAETAVFTAAGDFMSALTQEERAALCGIGVGAAGHISYDTGTWLQCYNIPISVPIPVSKRLSALYGLPVKMDNDVHCAYARRIPVWPREKHALYGVHKCRNRYCSGMRSRRNADPRCG